jgi:hypothetical protein
VPYSSISPGRKKRASYVVALVVGLLVATLAIPALASSHKTFTGAVAPSPVAEGTRELTFTISNTSASTQLGSANIEVPSTVRIQSQADVGSPVVTTNGVATQRGTAALVEAQNGQVIQLRDLSAPTGSKITIVFEADVTCGTGPATFGVKAKQANNFLGTGNDLDLNVAGSQLGLDCWPTSQADCDDDGRCETEASLEGVMTVKAAGTLKDGYDEADLTLTIQEGLLFGCGDEHSHAPHPTLLELDTEAFHSPLEASIIIHADGEDIGSAIDYQVCFEADYEFYDREGDLVTDEETPGTFGPALLHDCPAPLLDQADEDSIYPCVSEWENHEDGDREVRFLMPTEDPRFK